MDILCKDGRKELQSLMGENKEKRSISPLLSFERSGNIVY